MRRRNGDRKVTAQRDDEDDREREGHRAPSQRLTHQRRRGDHRQKRLQQLQLPHTRHAALRESAIPEEEAEEHRKHGQVSESQPRRYRHRAEDGRLRHPLSHRLPRSDRDKHRQGKQQGKKNP